MTIRTCFLLLGLGLSEGWHPVMGQALFVGEQQQCYVSSGTLVTLRGDLQNQGTLTHLGTLRLSGNWLGAGAFEAQPGSQVTLTGRDQQLAAREQSFASLSVEGGGTKTLASDARVRDTLRLTEGVIFPTPAASLTLASLASVVGGSDDAYVAERMQYQGRDSLTFPLGRNGRYLPLTLTEVEGTSPTLRGQITAPDPSATVGDRLVRVSPARYWDVRATEGTLRSARVTLAVTSEDGLDDLIGAVVAQAAEVGGPFSNQGQSASSGDAWRGSVTGERAITQPVVAVGLTTEFSVANQVLIPSAFAPADPNPVNRTLRVYAANLLPTGFSFRIFDRWGTLVYQAPSLAQARDEGWDGLYQSDRSPAPPGVYQYQLQGRFEGGLAAEQSGTITLFR